MAGKPIRVLIVDDEPLARQRLTDLLRAMPAQVIGTAENGEAAIAAIHELEPELGDPLGRAPHLRAGAAP